MIISRRTKAALVITAVVLVSLAAGFVLGAAAAKAVAKRKEDPAIWKPAAMKHLEKLKPTDAQRTRFQSIVDKAAAELSAIRAETAARANATLAKAMADLETELTPEQRETFARIRPKKTAAGTTP